MLKRLLRWWFAPTETKQDTTPQPLPSRARRTYLLRHIPRFDGAGPLPLGHWAPCHPSTMKRFKAQMTCPAGHSLTLRNHAVAADGRVYPSVVCMSENCGYHEVVQLDGWMFGDLLHEAGNRSFDVTPANSPKGGS